MKKLNSVAQEILENLKANCLTDEQILELEKKEKLARIRQRTRAALMYLEEKAGARVCDILRNKANWKETESVKQLRSLKPGGCAFLQGPAGCGKTTAGAWFTGLKMIEGFSSVYVDSSKLILENMFADVLVIDDIGSEFASEYWLAIFTSVINYRYAHRLTTVFLTNLTLKEWSLRYDKVQAGEEKEGRIFSRIAQWGREKGSVGLISNEPNLRLETHDSAKAQE